MSNVFVIINGLNGLIFPISALFVPFLKAYCSSGNVDLVEVIAYFCPKMALSSKITTSSSISLKLVAI